MGSAAFVAGACMQSELACSFVEQLTVCHVGSIELEKRHELLTINGSDF